MRNIWLNQIRIGDIVSACGLWCEATVIEINGETAVCLGWSLFCEDFRCYTLRRNWLTKYEPIRIGDTVRWLHGEVLMTAESEAYNGWITCSCLTDDGSRSFASFPQKEIVRCKP